jgi:hypothetical protein
MENISLIIDFEAFILPNCVIYRELSWVHLKQDVSDCVQIYTPSMHYRDLSEADQKTIRYCSRHIHGLRMCTRPINDGQTWLCNTESYIIELFEKFGGVFAFKGGQIEKRLLDNLNIPCLNLEEFGVPKANSMPVKVGCSKHGAFKMHCSLCECLTYKNYVTANLL